MSDEIISKIYEKVEKMSGDISEMRIEQTEIKADVKYHVKRSDMLQELYNDIKENDIEPMQEDISMAKGALKFLSILSVIVGLVYTVGKLFGKI